MYKRKLESVDIGSILVSQVQERHLKRVSLRDGPLIGSEATLPLFQQAAVVRSFDEEITVSDQIPIPQRLEDHEILIRNKYTGLNHVDWKSKKYRFNIHSFPWINGRESSGIVIRRGAKVDRSRFPIGAEVFMASTCYRELKTSTFQEFTVFDSRLVWRLPRENLSDGTSRKRFGLDFAAGVGVALVTAGSALSSFVDFNEIGKADPDKSLVVWGGSSSVGIFTIQLARNLGIFKNIIAVSSLRYEEYLKELGATAVIDRTLPPEELAKKFQESCPTGADYGIDVISKKTAEIVLEILKNGKGTKKSLVCLSGAPGEDVRTRYPSIKVENVGIKRFHEDLVFGETFVKFTSELFEKGQLNPVRSVKVFKGFGKFGVGLSNGLKELEERGASAEKFVVRL
ncbi:LAQU0S17e02476g1_1 [Lachancea quebecensis]|uniref:LAQU0S17e02476g1_1 n=1 Tax=Lachancea quebecensis TaxID=1654605 RepID=A0A0P1KX73_9SACH|nr:LAQU0S17e02476g1_1 [Lachancea quebecensis]